MDCIITDLVPCLCSSKVPKAAYRGANRLQVPALGSAEGALPMCSPGIQGTGVLVWV